MGNAETPGFHVAVVGASSLKGKELKEALEQRSFPTRRLTLLDDEELTGQLTEFQGEPAVVRAIDLQSFDGVDFVFFASSLAFTRNVWKAAERAGCRIIDLTGALEQEAGARIAGPLAADLSRPPGTPAPEPGSKSAGRLFIAAHPAALVVGAVLGRLRDFSVTRAIVNIFEPASERGAAGVDELHQQTLSLLSFQPPPRKVFDTQVAFNLLAACGEESRPSLADVEQRIARHICALVSRNSDAGGTRSESSGLSGGIRSESSGLPGGLPAGPAGDPERTLRVGAQPSLRLAQAPVFHGHSFSFYVELERPRGLAEIERAFEGDGFDLRRGGSDLSGEPPSAVGAAASNDILVGDIRADSAARRGYWLWAAADNLRLLALNAVRIAELA